MTWPMTWSLSASVFVSCAVWVSRSETVGPSPWKTSIISADSSLICFGASAWNSGWKPLNRSVRSSAGAVRVIGMTVAARQRMVERAGALVQGDVALADQVAVLDGRGDRRRETHVGLDREADLRLAAPDDLDRADLADPDAGHPDVVADVERRDVGEDRAVVMAARARSVHDRQGEHGGGQRRHRDEDDALDDRPDEALHRTLTWAPRSAGPSSRLDHCGSRAGALPGRGASNSLMNAFSAGEFAAPIPLVVERASALSVVARRVRAPRRWLSSCRCAADPRSCRAGSAGTTCRMTCAPG